MVMDSPQVGTCYVSGPMHGRPGHNYPAFQHAAVTLRGEGWIVQSPHEGGPTDAQVLAACRAEGVSDFRLTSLYARLMRRDFAWILASDAVFVLEGWQGSRGARSEVLVAATAGIPVLTFEGRQPVLCRLRTEVMASAMWEAA